MFIRIILFQIRYRFYADVTKFVFYFINNFFFNNSINKNNKKMPKIKFHITTCIISNYSKTSI